MEPLLSTLNRFIKQNDPVQYSGARCATLVHHCPAHPGSLESGGVAHLAAGQLRQTSWDPRLRAGSGERRGRTLGPTAGWGGKLWQSRLDEKQGSCAATEPGAVVPTAPPLSFPAHWPRSLRRSQGRGDLCPDPGQPARGTGCWRSRRPELVRGRALPACPSLWTGRFWTPAPRSAVSVRPAREWFRLGTAAGLEGGATRTRGGN